MPNNNGEVDPASLTPSQLQDIAQDIVDTVNNDLKMFGEKYGVVAVVSAVGNASIQLVAITRVVQPHREA